ncbi:unnamed protein product [Symbiodinium natans]|uniref:Uncharacterized protein n=1 Tax=Symbiodinium natans TaxID=878477 RepID=A0A812RRI2_9DINO|nr:unnamed protein product [Symbiodinium natans]
MHQCMVLTRGICWALSLLSLPSRPGHAVISAHPGFWVLRLRFGAMSRGVWSLLLAASLWWPFPCNGQSCLLQYKTDTETTHQTYQAQAQVGMELVVPIYQWPAPLAGSMYEQVATSSARSTTIINPGNGLANQCQGSLPLDPVWRPVVTLFDSNPLARTIGYVYSQWGSHSLAVVKQSIDNYFACFDVAGIFVDETATDPSKCNGNDAYYDQLYAYVKSKDPSAEVMCNPGTGFDYESWKHCCDRAMVVEVSLSSFTSGFKDPSPFTGPTGYPPGFAVVLVYGVPGVAEMQQVVRRAACSNFTNADGIWVLEEGGGGILPGYTTMPGYFAQQVDFVKTAIEPECPPPPAPPVYTQAPSGGSCWFNPNDLNCEICFPGYNQCSWQGCYKHQCSPSGGSACTNPCSGT